VIYICVVLTIICIAQAFFLIRFADSIFQTEDSIEESLDVIDNSYGRISEILEKPLFYDSAEVRQILHELSRSRDALLYVANVMSSKGSKEEKEIV